MEKHGRELTCRGVYDILDELKNVCLNEEDAYGYASLMVDAYNNIKNTSPIGDNDDEGEYPDLVIIGGEDDDGSYIDSFGLEFGWTVIEVKSQCVLTWEQLSTVCPDKAYDKGTAEEFYCYRTPSNEIYITSKED